jgi:hypothetical protein
MVWETISGEAFFRGVRTGLVITVAATEINYEVWGAGENHNRLLHFVLFG